MGNCEGKRALGRRKWRGVDIKMNVKGTGSEGVVWINLAEEKNMWRGLQNMVMDLRMRSVLPSALHSRPHAALPLPTAPQLPSQRDGADERCLPCQKLYPAPSTSRVLCVVCLWSAPCDRIYP